jgi:hypothetical protein
MAQVIGGKSFEELRHPRRRKFLKWLDGQIWALKRGEDFKTECAVFRACLYMTAKRYYGPKFIVRTRTIEDQHGYETIAVQLQRRDDGAGAGSVSEAT